MCNFMMYNIPCCAPELGAFARGEEDGLSLVGIEVVLVVVVLVGTAVGGGGGGGVFPPPSIPVLSGSVGEVDVSVINWVVGV